MAVRQMAVADAFYEGDATRCERSIRKCIGDFTPPEKLGRVVGGVVPHAGWVYSGATAAKVFVTLRAHAKPETIVLFGAVHQWGVTRLTIDAHSAWATPLGDAEIDGELAEAILAEAGGEIARSARAHVDEHSIEVQVPFVKHLFPEARILPIAVPPAPNAIAAGERVARAIKKLSRQALVVATTDLTHYGMHYRDFEHGRLPAALAWVKGNDRRMVSLIERLDAEAVMSEANANANACGPGAVAAGVAAAREMGAAEAVLLEYTTSADVIGDTAADSAVGYAGLVFCAAQ
jgi:AmmeMemoRadiSam system protein B